MSEPLLAALARGLAAVPPAQVEPPATGRVGATLVLLRELPGGELEITYTRRQPTLSSHPGQISFPGGRVDPGEGVVDAALREAHEEIGLDPSTATVLGRLPAFYIPPSRFWMATVVARWDRPHPLVPHPAEVESVLGVSTATLRQPERWRAVPLSAAGATWAWQLAPQRLLWGATAAVTGVLLQLADPMWSGGVAPEDLPPDRHVRPWEDPVAAGVEPSPSPSRAKLVDVPAEEVGAAEDVDGAGAQLDAGALADDVVHAIRRLARRPAGPVVVLAGPAEAGEVARMVVGELVGEGEEVVLVDVGEEPSPAVVDRAVRAAGVLVDGLADRRTALPLPPAVRRVIRALQVSGAPLIAVDLPSGIDPRAGMVGEAVSADVTVAAAPLLPAHVAPGVTPFVGDLYLSRPGRPLVRAVPAVRPGAWAE